MISYLPPSYVTFSILMIDFRFVIRQTRSRSSSHDKTENVRASSVPDRRVTRHSLESVPSRGWFCNLLNYSNFQTLRCYFGTLKLYLGGLTMVRKHPTDTSDFTTLYSNIKQSRPCWVNKINI